MVSMTLGRPPPEFDDWSDDEDGSDGEIYIPMGSMSNKPQVAAKCWDDDDWDTPDDTPTGDRILNEIDKEENIDEKVRLCCLYSCLDKLKEILTAQANFDINKYLGANEETALVIACLAGHYDIIDYLLRSKTADPNKKNPHYKTTPLIAVASCQSADVGILVKCATNLITAGANLNDQDREGFTPLINAITRKAFPLVKLFLDEGASSNLADYQGDTPLQHAVIAKDGRMCRLLIIHGADVDVSLGNGLTVVDVAQDKDLSELSNFLRIVRDTKWKPELDPTLMTDVDEDLVEERWAKKDEILVMEDSSILLMLEAVDGGKYITNFRTHCISYPTFITLTEDQLIEIGVDDDSIRKALLENMKQTNTAQHAIRQISTNKNITAAETLCLINDIKTHLDRIAESLDYLTGKIEKHPLSLRLDLERNNIPDMIKACEETVEFLVKMEEKTFEIEDALMKIIESTGTPSEDLLQLKERPRLRKKSVQSFHWKQGQRLIVGLGIVSIGLFAGIQYLKKF